MPLLAVCLPFIIIHSPHRSCLKFTYTLLLQLWSPLLPSTTPLALPLLHLLREQFKPTDYDRVHALESVAIGVATIPVVAALYAIDEEAPDMIRVLIAAHSLGVQSTEIIKDLAYHNSE